MALSFAGAQPASSAMSMSTPQTPPTAQTPPVEEMIRENFNFRLDSILYLAFKDGVFDLQKAADIIIQTMISNEYQVYFNRNFSLDEWRENRNFFQKVMVFATLVAYANKGSEALRIFNTIVRTDPNPINPFNAFVVDFLCLIDALQRNLTTTNLRDRNAPYPLADSFMYEMGLNNFLRRINPPSVIRRDSVITWVMYTAPFALAHIFQSNRGEISPLNRADFKQSFANNIHDFCTNQIEIAHWAIGYPQDARLLTLDNIQLVMSGSNIPRPVPVVHAPLASVITAVPVATPPTRDIALKQTIKAGLEGTPTTERVEENEWKFRINGIERTLRRPKGLNAIANQTFDAAAFAIRKYIEIYPPAQNSVRYTSYGNSFEQSIKAFDVYAFGAIAYDALCHAIKTKINVVLAENPALANPDVANRTTIVRSGSGVEELRLAAHENLDAIGFPRNHGMHANVHMFRPEYELPELYKNKMQFFSQAFGIGEAVKPNYHVEQLVAGMAQGKAPGNGPKPIEIANELCNQYALLSKIFRHEIRYLINFETRKPAEAREKWESFFTDATKGVCADEYLKALVEWQIVNGSVSDPGDVQVAAVAVTNSGIVRGIVNTEYRKMSQLHKDALIAALKGEHILDAHGYTDYSGPYGQMGQNNSLATPLLNRVFVGNLDNFLRTVRNSLRAQNQAPSDFQLLDIIIENVQD